MTRLLALRSHFVMFLSSSPGGTYAGIALNGFAFGTVWPMMVQPDSLADLCSLSAAARLCPLFLQPPPPLLFVTHLCYLIFSSAFFRALTARSVLFDPPLPAHTASSDPFQPSFQYFLPAPS